MLDPGVDVEGAVRGLLEAQMAIESFRLRWRLRELGLDQEVVRRGRRGLEVQALHRPDAMIGEVWQEHRRHGRAVVLEDLVVLPERPTAPLRFADPTHLTDHVEELTRVRRVELLHPLGGARRVVRIDGFIDDRVTGFRFEAFEVPLGPVTHRAVIGRRPVQPRVGGLTGRRTREHRSPRQLTQRHTERTPQHEHGDSRHHR